MPMHAESTSGSRADPSAVPLADQIEIGWLIRRLRRSRQQPHNGRPWTQEDLAVVIGTDAGHISRIESGETLPTRSMLERIANALELTVSQQRFLLGLAH